MRHKQTAPWSPRTGTRSPARLAVTAAAPHVVARAKAPRARPLHLEQLEDRSLLAAVLVDLNDSADTGRSNLDNITNKMPEVGDVVFYFPQWAGKLPIPRPFLVSTANAYVNGVGSDTHLAVVSSATHSNANDVQESALENLWEGQNLISITTEYVDLDTSIQLDPDNGFEETTGEIVLDGDLTIFIDLTDPTGDGQLHPDSDTGVLGASGTKSDRITADPTPTFFGVTEGNNLVTVGFLDPVTGPYLAGATIADPRDGDSVPGRWRVDTDANLADGAYYANFTFEDVAGNTFTDSTVIDDRWFMVDTQGPRVTGVEVNSPGNPYDLFDLAPAAGPTPLVQSLIVQLADANLRTDRFLYDAVFADTATNVGNYQVVGDANGVIPIESVIFTPLVVAPGQPATGYVTINFREPLPDDRFTLRIADNLVDVAGNALDGESNAIAAGTPQMPSGNGQPGGDFIARFTIDSRAEIGAWGGGRMHLDTNGNLVFDANNADAANRDLWLTRGPATDLVFAGDFDGSGFDQAAAYRKTSSGIKWLVSDDRFATQALYGSKGPKGIPVAGEFNGNPADGDEVGLLAGKRWYFDTSNPKDFRLDRSVPSKVQGLPIVGNFDGLGGVDLGIYNPKTNKFLLSLDSQGGGITNGKINAAFGVGSGFPFNGVQERPVVGDMDRDGFDDIGLYRVLQSRDASSVWSFFVSGGQSLLNRVQQGFMSFLPRPFGPDLFTWFGNKFQQPIVGNFDPPFARVNVSAQITSGASHAADPLAQNPLSAMTRDSAAGFGKRTPVVSSQASIDELLVSLQSLQDLLDARRVKPATSKELAIGAQSEDGDILNDALAADVAAEMNPMI